MKTKWELWDKLQNNAIPTVQTDPVFATPYLAMRRP